jgi:hypothetical protein
MKHPNETLAKSFENDGSSPNRQTGSWQRFTLLDRLVEDLSSPDAYLHEVDEVTVVKTPLSVVFLAGEWVYKVKQPVRLPFVDLSTLEQRVAACHEEIRLNRRTTRRVYSGVTPIIFRNGRHRVAGAGSPVEYAVCMRRLPAECSLDNMRRRGALQSDLLRRLAERIASFHASAERGRRISSHAQFASVKASVTDCFWQTAETVGRLVSPTVHQRLEALVTAQMRTHAKLIEARALRGVPCDTHGDLRLEHIYVDAQQRPPHDLAIIDCLEYNDRLRAADPVEDLACLTMDLTRFGRHDLAEELADAFFEVSEDEEGKILLPLYMAHRALSRAKLDTIRTRRIEPDDELDETRETERKALLTDAQGLWLAALSIVETPRRRPCLVLVAGAPNERSALAHGLEHLGFKRVVVAANSLVSTEPTPDGDAVATGRIGDCMRAVNALVFEGERVVVEGPMFHRAERSQFIACADRWGLARRVFVCSDAENQMPDGWQDLGAPSAQFAHLLPGGEPEKSLAEACQVLFEAGLLGQP